MNNEEYDKFLKKYQEVSLDNKDINIYEEFQKPQNKVRGLPQTLVRGFQEYLDRNNIPCKDYDNTVSIYVNRLDTSSKTKRAYRNRLRALINNILVKQ